MKTLFYSITTFIILLCSSAQLRAQGSFSNFYMYVVSNTCANANLYYTTNSCNFTVGDIITATTNFGDGSLNAVSTFTFNSAPCDSFNNIITHTYSTAGAYIATTTFSAIGASSQVVSTTVYANTCDVISGFAYIDGNTNCTKNIGEAILPNVLVALKVNGNTIQTDVTDASGYYEFNYTNNITANYTVEITNCNAFLSCSTANVIAIINPSTTNANFGFNPNITATNLTTTNVASYSNGNCGNSFIITLSADANNISNQPVNFAIDYGDGSTGSATGQLGSSNVLCTIDSLATAQVSHTYNTPGTYVIVITSSSNGIIAPPYNYTIVVQPSSCLHFEGKVYGDANTNCTFDVGEIPVNIETIILKENGNNFAYSYTDINGFYEFNTAFTSGSTYVIERYNTALFVSCASNSGYTVTTSSANNLNFGLSTNPYIYIDDSISNNLQCGLTQNFMPNCYGTFLNTAGTYTMNIDFGDGITGSQTTSTFNYINGIYSQPQFTQVPHTYSAAGNYIVTFTALDASGVIGTLSSPISIGLCGNYSGNIFEDGNGNCIKDAGEQNFTSSYIFISSNNINVGSGYTDNQGNYSIPIPYIPGQTYITEIYPYNWNTINCYTVSCPSTLTYANTAQTVTNLNFAVEPNNTSFDLYTSYMNPIATGGFNAGNNYTVYTTFGNYLCANVGGTVSVTLDPNITFVSSSAPGYTVSGNVVSWPVSNLSTNYWYNAVYFVINVPFLKANNTPFAIGDTVCLTSSITASIAGDANPANNTYNKCYIIGTAYDPNDKQVFPKGKSAEGIVPQNQTLEYVVRFENTGTAPAQNIIVRDTIDANLDINSMEVISSSHFMNTTKVGNAVAFTFPNIMLPDSTTNKEKSNGFVKFSIKPKTGLAIGTKVKNTASIYFDANPAIITNTTKNQLGAIPDAIELLSKKELVSIYPNPAYTTIDLQFTNTISENVAVTIYNTMGQIVCTQQVSTKKSSIDISKFTNGIYTIKLIQNNEQQVLKFVKN